MNYTAKQVTTLLNIPYWRLDYYLRNDLVSLRGRKSGKRTSRIFSENNLFELILVHELNTVFNMPVTKIKKTMKDIRKNDPKILKMENYDENLYSEVIEEEEPELSFFSKEKVSLFINFDYIAHLVREASA